MSDVVIDCELVLKCALLVFRGRLGPPLQDSHHFLLQQLLRIGSEQQSRSFLFGYVELQLGKACAQLLPVISAGSHMRLLLYALVVKVQDLNNFALVLRYAVAAKGSGLLRQAHGIFLLQADTQKAFSKQGLAIELEGQQ